MAEAFELAIVGGGLTGLAAAWRACKAGLSTLLVAETPGSLPHTSGALDLIGVYPTETKRYRAHPWEALSELIERDPGHPYSRVGLKEARSSVEAFLSYLQEGPLAYYRRPEENIVLVTAAGTVKPTYAVSATMKHNILAWMERKPTLIVGFDRLPDFSPEQVVENLRNRWSGLRAARIDPAPLFDSPRRVTATHLAAAFEEEEFRGRIAERIEPLLGPARYLGLPAVLGLERAMEVCGDLEARLGVRVFEIPMITPSLPGLRLAAHLKDDLLRMGVQFREGAPVRRIEAERRRVTRLYRQGKGRTECFRARNVILATGRFFGGGLAADRRGVRETLLGLPVKVPASRDNWHMSTFLGAPGHPINRAGIEVDRRLRPLGEGGRPLYENLFAAGALLAGHDWVREKSGAGISLVTGQAAVASILLDRDAGVPRKEGP